MPLQDRRKHGALVLDDQVNQDVAHVEDEAQDGVEEIHPHMSFQSVCNSPKCGEDKRKAKKAKRRVERLSGKVDIEPEGWDLENYVACGSCYVKDILDQIEKQDDLNPKRKGAPTAELI